MNYAINCYTTALQLEVKNTFKINLMSVIWNCTINCYTTALQLEVKNNFKIKLISVR